PRNVLRIVWKGPSYAGPPGAVAWLLSTSEFYLPRYYETELPELGLLQFQLYPFSLKGDLSDVLVVLPNDLNEESFSALLELSVGFARLAPAQHLAFRVRRLGDLTGADLSESHLVFLNLEGRRDPSTALLSNWKPTPRMESLKGRPTIREMASPWNPQRYALVISAQSGRQLHRAVSEGLSESNLPQLRGDVAYLAANRPESFVLGPRRKLAEYSYQIFVEAWLRAHWLALPIILITVSGLLFVGVRLALRHYGRNRAFVQLDRPS
ncbi:MAG: cellulose biosynthesis cyclic di-GMP-binding regulatory protein BcsB, partial [Candidatus Methylomirabilaceae bacterium]